MRRHEVHCGFVPLTDAAVPIIAAEMGFAAQEGLDLILHRENAWAALRDKLAMGRLDAAHMLSPAPVAMSMGLGGLARPIDALTVLSVNGDVIGVSPALAERMRAAGAPADFMDAAGAGRALIDAAEHPLRLGVPYPFSMHAELVYYWLGALGLTAPEGLSVRTVPPPLMAEAMAMGEIDAFCVGEPWGSIAVERGVGELILPGCAIWRFAPEKVLAVRRGWAEEREDAAHALIRACWRAARWIAEPGRAGAVARVLAEPRWLDVSAEVIERSLTGRLRLRPGAEEVEAPRFLAFHAGAAGFPWRSQAVWIASRLARRNGLDAQEAAAAARACFRPDLYRAALAPHGADLPGASEKVEGALHRESPVASSRGEMFLGPDAFFDGKEFDPDCP